MKKREDPAQATLGFPATRGPPTSRGAGVRIINKLKPDAKHVKHKVKVHKGDQLVKQGTVLLRER